MQAQWQHIDTQNTEIYEDMGIPMTNDKAVVFELNASHDGHIGFFTAARDLRKMYEIVISDWDNAQSTIRRGSGGPAMAASSTEGLLHAGLYTQLWADAKDGLVRLGRGKVVGNNVILEWQDPQPLDVESVGLMTGWGTCGKWRLHSDYTKIFVCQISLKNEGEEQEKMVHDVSAKSKMHWFGDSTKLSAHLV